ncbi:hypothetical protein [Sphingomonas sp.]|uniref:hypothetical protein n=1 Tax=Sphingomonas sp. TaxID=28214 RepID=UPI002DD6AF5F|nr:hypothetical protein [Sphingomonas sp.]
MLAIIASLLLAQTGDPFPERSPGLIQACLQSAAEAGEVGDTDRGTKFMCVDESAAQLWAFLEQAKVEAWEQDTGAEGVWLSRAFPLGGCFKKLRDSDGAEATSGLSCSIWIPRPPRATKKRR